MTAIHTEGLPMFVPHNAEPTSRAAAERIAPSTALLREQVYAAIAVMRELGATEPELEQALRLAGNTLRPRLWELEGNGAGQGVRRIQKCGKRNKHAIYVTIEEARRAA